MINDDYSMKKKYEKYIKNLDIINNKENKYIDIVYDFINECNLPRTRQYAWR